MHRSLSVVAAAVLGASVAACGPMGRYSAEARDTWSRSYTLSRNGEVSIGNVNGRVVVEGVDGSSVEVEAERVAKAATEQLAADLLPRIPINDHSTPDLVRIETGRINGILIGASYEVRYHVKAPKDATIRATTVNGAVEVSGLDGRITARTTNGGVEAKDVTGSLDARTVNGGVRARFTALGAHDITLGVVNGGVRVSLPETAKATVNATWVNGGFHSSGLKFDVRDSGRRHFEGVLNGGGTSITMTTVNGGVSVVSAGTADSEGEADDTGDGKRLKSLKQYGQ